MENWMRVPGVAMKIGDVRVTSDMIDEIGDHTPILDAGYGMTSSDAIET